MVFVKYNNINSVFLHPCLPSVLTSSSLILFLSRAPLSASTAGSCRRSELWGGTWPCRCTPQAPGTAAAPAQTGRTRSWTPGYPAPRDPPSRRPSLQKSRWAPLPGRRPAPPWRWGLGDVHTLQSFWVGHVSEGCQKHPLNDWIICFSATLTGTCFLQPPRQKFEGWSDKEAHLDFWSLIPAALSNIIHTAMSSQCARKCLYHQKEANIKAGKTAFLLSRRSLPKKI